MSKGKSTREVFVGSVGIGGDNPIRIQSMTNTDTRDAHSTLEQIKKLAGAGCEIVRLAVPDGSSAFALEEIKKASPLPLIADVHFDHRLALQALETGVDGLRINPGNIGEESKVDRVVAGAAARKVPIRIGVNAGSLHKDVLHKWGGPTPEAMSESALKHVHLLESRGFYDIKVSLKSSSVPVTVQAYKNLSERVDYPLHIGVTEAGTPMRGAVKSSVGLGILLYEGIGDTLRVSLTSDPVQEVGVAWEILRSLGLRHRGPEIISCPTCGRTEIDLISLTNAVEDKLRDVQENFKVAVMGCAVNGPGEAKEADIGLAGGRDCGIIFAKGKVLRKVRGQENLLDEFMSEVDRFLWERNS